eukprot:evm.model.scf_128EXC.7 EVM.evm.TU.scf_128EXC.7   scf_128EXC:61938-69453(-)
MWYECTTGSLRMDTYNGTDKSISVKGVVQYEVVPRIDELVCLEWDADSGEGDDLLGNNALPDPSNWSYAGDAFVDGKTATQWVYRESLMEKDETYRFYFDVATGEPIRLAMMGTDYFSGAHYDEYIVKFMSFKTGISDPSVFAVPELCDYGKAVHVEGETAVYMNMRALIPRVHAGDAEYDSFSGKYGRFHSSPSEYRMRLDHYRSNKQFIDEWNNRTDVSHKVEVNRFADWTDAEFRATKMGLLTAGKGAYGDLSPLKESRMLAPVYEMGGAISDLPEEVDWQHTGADTAVKDQATCGSCWAFAASSAMSAAYYLKTGTQYSFSEQQLVDCAWDEGNYACDGGWAETAIDYVANAGGILLEDEYQYKGQDGFCNADKSEVAARFSGYTAVPYRNISATKDALYRKGPMAVAIDANHPGFRFYSSGIFTNPECMFEEEDLDHAVTLVGYGKDPEGKEYWKIRNSWSRYWGDDGYVKISMEYDCGVTTRPVSAVVEDYEPGSQATV